jgi:outer membrane protein assembly factor BamA
MLPDKSSSQGAFSIDIILHDSTFIEKEGKIKYPDRVKNSKEAYDELQYLIKDLYSKGYLTAGFDSITSDSVSITAWLHTGQQYNWASINTGKVDPVILNQVRFKDRYFTEREINIEDLSFYFGRIITYYENNGYPFAMVTLDSLEILDNKISADLVAEKGPLITMDSLTVKGPSKLKTAYLRNYLDIKPGQLYDEDIIKKVGSRLKELQFANEIRPYEVGFTEEKANLILYLDKKRASQFDGIIGIAPNDVTPGRILITGDIKLKLASVFNRGEIIDFNWRRLESQTQDLKIRFRYPYLFSTPFGIDYRFWLLKQDTSFITLNNNIGLDYQFESNHYLKVFFEAINSSLLSTSGLENTTTLPDVADINSINYGLEYNISRLDYLFNPRRGYSINVFGSFGTKKIKQNPGINEEVYDSIQLESNVYNAGGIIKVFIPLFRGGTFHIASDNGYIESDNLFQNELYRIGGLNTLRGFDESSIFTSYYSILKAEFRYLFEQDSYFSVFWNGAYYENRAAEDFISDTPWGFGAGVSFRTGAGIFSAFYALGKQFGNPFDLRAAKIHFGYTSVF